MKMNGPDSLNLPQIHTLPGYAIRRLHQISTGIFHQEVSATGMTPLQYGALQTLHEQPDIDQRTLASCIALDASTTAGVVDRLEARGLLIRRMCPTDKRVRLLSLTDAGEQLLRDVVPSMLRAQEVILAPLTERQREEFMHLLEKLIVKNNEYSRAPGETAR